jgi:hypothetical protein
MQLFFVRHWTLDRYPDISKSNTMLSVCTVMHPFFKLSPGMAMGYSSRGGQEFASLGANCVFAWMKPATSQEFTSHWSFIFHDWRCVPQIRGSSGAEGVSPRTQLRNSPFNITSSGLRVSILVPVPFGLPLISYIVNFPCALYCLYLSRSKGISVTLVYNGR